MNRVAICKFWSVCVLSMYGVVFSIIVYAECRHIQILCSHVEFLV